MGFWDKLFKGKVYEDKRSPTMAGEMELCGEKYLLSEFDLDFDRADNTREYFRAYAVFAEPDSTSDCGVTGIYISYDAMLERCEVAADAKSCELSISLYSPYTGDYKIYTLCSSISNGVSRVQERIA